MYYSLHTGIAQNLTSPGSYAACPSSIPPPDWGEIYMGGEARGPVVQEPHLGSFKDFRRHHR